MMGDDVANVPEVLLGLPKVATGPAGIGHLGRGQCDEVEGARHLWVAVSNKPSQSCQMESLAGIRLHPLAAFSHQEAHQRWAAKSVPGSFYLSDALIARESEELLQVPG